ncbi:hypothetical protein AeMF1_016231 [Aphanomyces euteiches]|nr:hypothetical protein AeMF1_016231 [Aphanomyces euteiches]
MLKLFCVVVGHEGSPFSVNVPADETVDDLKKKINDEMKRLPAASELQLYRVDGLSQDDNEQIVYNGTTIDMPNCSLVDFGSSTKKMAALSWISESFIEADVNIRWKIHVLVVVPSVQDQSSKSSDAEPLLKKVKITQPYVVCQGPVGVDFYSVPMETIPAYRKLSALYSAEAPSCDSFANDTSVFVVYHSATELSVATEEAFWMALGQLCGEVASTPQELMKIIIRRKQRLFLIVDEMDGMFVNSVLTSHFLDILREWLRSPHFRGFLGIGSYDLVSLYKHHKGNDRVSPFNLATIVKSDRFSADQINDRIFQAYRASAGRQVSLGH